MLAVVCVFSNSYPCHDQRYVTGVQFTAWRPDERRVRDSGTSSQGRYRVRVSDGTWTADRRRTTVPVPYQLSLQEYVRP